jgi:hypothetical protein
VSSKKYKEEDALYDFKGGLREHLQMKELFNKVALAKAKYKKKSVEDAPKPE